MANSTEHRVKSVVKQPKPSEMSRELLAEYLRERIYGLITLLAINIGLFAAVDHLTTWAAVVTVVSTVVGLWGAALFADVMSYRVLHDKSMPTAEFRHIFIAKRGILVAAISTLFFLILAAIDIVSLRNALLIDIILSALALLVILIRSAKTSSNTWLTTGIILGFQAIFAIGVIWLKFSAH